MGLSDAGPGAQIGGLDPALLTVGSAYPSEPLLALFDPPVELASWRPHSYVHRYRRVDNAAIRLGDPLQVSVAQLHI
jgi:hypothetical protein